MPNLQQNQSLKDTLRAGKVLTVTVTTGSVGVSIPSAAINKTITASESFGYFDKDVTIELSAFSGSVASFEIGDPVPASSQVAILTATQSARTDITGVVAATYSGGFLLPNGDFAEIKQREYLLTNYGEMHLAKAYTCSISAGSNECTISGYTVTTEDIGKTIGIAGAGVNSADFSVVANDGVYVGTITGVSAGKAILSSNATNTVSSANCIFGFDCDDAFTAAIAKCRSDYAVDGIPGVIVIPSGRFIVVDAQPIGSGVSFRGCGRGISTIYVTKIVSDANDSTTASWIRKASGQALTVYDNVNLSDFTLRGTYYACSGVYGPDMKMINMSLTSNSTVQRMEIIDNPSTALGYDESINCLLADNIILNPGRVARITSITGTAGGSGIGIAISGQNKDISMIVRNNFIKGKWTSSGGTGRSGINIEAAATTSIPTTYYGGIILEGNYIEGMYNGIIDSGGIGTIAKGNTVRNCTRGIVSGSNGVSVGSMGRNMSIVGNVVRNCFTFSAGSYTGVGIQVTGSNANSDTGAECLITDNIVSGTVGGYGIQINGTSSYPVRSTIVRDNWVGFNGLSGIRISGTIKGLDVAGNMCVSNGQSGTTGNKAPVSVGASTSWTDGRLQNNTYTDYQAVPTQDATQSISGSAVLTNVRINGNTGDAS